MQSTQAARDRQRRLAELERIAELQMERNSDRTKQSAETLIQQYLAEDPQVSGNNAPEDSSPEQS
jgi:hypothetical protein